MTKKKKKMPVYCKGCANLLFLPGFPPQCLATAEFVIGPLRDKIDVIDREVAEKRNFRNNCKYRKGWSLRAYRLKKWILWRINDEGRKRPKIREGCLKDYSVGEECGKKKDYLKECREERTVKKDATKLIEELKQAEEERYNTEEANGEDILDDGGTHD